MLSRLIEPKITREIAPQALEVFESGQASIKPVVLYMFNCAFWRVSNSMNGNFIDTVNMSRISEDIYLEVRMLQEEL